MRDSGALIAARCGRVFGAARPGNIRHAVAGHTRIRCRFRRGTPRADEGPGRRTAVSLLVARDAIGELAEDVEVAIVPGGLLDQVRDDVPQRERLAGTFVPPDCF